MKRQILLLAIFIIISQIAFCQTAKISSREENDEMLTIGTCYTMVKMDNQQELGPSVCYRYDKRNGLKTFYLCFWIRTYEYNRISKFGIDKGAKVIIKTRKGSVITAVNRFKDYNYSTDGELHSGGQIYKLLTAYEIEKADLDTIVQEGITKVRFETTCGFRDYYSEKSNALGELIASQCDLIQGKENFSEGF